MVYEIEYLGFTIRVRRNGFYGGYDAWSDNVPGGRIHSDLCTGRGGKDRAIKYVKRVIDGRLPVEPTRAAVPEGAKP